MTYNAGSAQASYILDISQPKQAAAELRALFQGIQQSAKVPALGVGKSAPTADELKYAQAIARTAEAQARLATATNKRAESDAKAARAIAQTELIDQKRATEAARTAAADDRAAIAAQRRAQVEERAARASAGGIGSVGGLPILPRTLESFGTGAIDQFKTGLLGIVGPAAVASAGIAALGNTVESFKKAFVFKAELDQNRASIAAQLSGIRDSKQAFEEARVFADKYKLTQEETTTAIQASVPLLRQSKSSLTDVLGVLAQLQVLKPEQGIQGAAFALAELQGGQSRSLATRFNIPIAQANELKQQILQGGDAVQLLGAYLDKAGIGAQALAVRTQGAAGALNDVKVATEELTIAQGNLAASKGGIAIVQEQATVYRGLANLLNGDVVGGLKAQGATIAATQVAQQAYNQAIAAGKTETEAAAFQQSIYDQALKAAYIDLGLFTPAQTQAATATNNHSKALRDSANALGEEAQKKLEDQIVTAGLSQQQAQLELDSRRAAQGLLGAGDQALNLARKYGIATDQAQFLINAQQAIGNATALADQRQGERDPNSTQTAKEFDAFSKLARAGQNERDAKAAADAKALRAAQDALNLSRASTKEQKIAELTRQKAATTDPVEKLRLQAQIEQEKRTGAGRVGAAQSTALQLQNVEQNSGLQLLKTQRENLERLRDQEQDFTLRRVRSKEDEDRKIRGLLARGQIAEANRERETFAIQQRRDQEDFNIQRQRTVRNNAESTGDIGARTDLRTEQIGNRAALRGGATGGASLGGGAPPASLGGTGAPAPSVIQINVNAVTNLDGVAVGNLIFDVIQQRLDDTLSLQLRSATPPGAGQSAVAGGRP